MSDSGSNPDRPEPEEFGGEHPTRFGNAPDASCVHDPLGSTELATSRLWRGDQDVQSVSAMLAELPPLAPHRYRLGPEIGRGGVGVVYRGWDDQLGREVSFKALLPAHMGKPGVLRRFLEEARITCRLQHPGVVAIHDLGRLPDGRPCIVMSLVEGENLDQILARRPDPTHNLTTLLSVFEKVCEVIAHAHDVGVIHRDLKPSNVRVGPFGVVKVMDWGLGKILAESPAAVDPKISPASPGSPHDTSAAETQIGTVFGTPAYLSPEQARGDIDRVDTRSDVFGLGGLLCEILTGKAPHLGETSGAAFEQAARGDLSDALARLDAVPAPLDLVQLARQCLDPDADRRPASGVHVAEAISRYVRWDQARAERDLVRFFDLSLDLFCIADTQGFFRRVNDNFTRILGHSAEDLTSRPFLDFVHPDDQPRTLHEIEGLARGEPTIQFVNRYRTASDSYIWLEWCALRVPEENAVYAVARDVTDRIRIVEAHQQAEASRLHLAQLVDSAQVAIIVCDRSGRIQSWNPAAQHLLGFSASEMIGQSAETLAPLNSLDAQQEVLSRLSGCESVEHHESHYQTKDGRALPVLVTLSPVRNDAGTIVGVAKILRDLSERRNAQAALSRSQARVQALLDRDGSPALLVDEHGTIDAITRAAACLFGYAESDIVGCSLDRFLVRHAPDATGPLIWADLSGASNLATAEWKDLSLIQPDTSLLPIVLTLVALSPESSHLRLALLRERHPTEVP